MKVMKFGGHCLRDGEAFRRAARIVLAERARKVVVVSAMEGITDLLEQELARCASAPEAAADLVCALRRRHRAALRRAIRRAGLRRSARRRLDAKLWSLECLLHASSCRREVGPALRAHVLSYGERLAALLLALTLKDSGAEARACDADEIGIVTDESFDHATALLTAVRRNLLRKLLPQVRRATIPVITGFFGCTAEGKVTLFGRNGSDYSAAVIARALGAAELELWKDVGGVMSADPELAHDARLLDHLSYMEAVELCHFGARVLHPRTMEPLAGTGIPLHIRSFRQPEAPGTEIAAPRCRTAGGIRSVACTRRVALLRICSPGAGSRPEVVAEAARRLAADDIEILSMMTSRTCISFLLHHTAAAAGRRALDLFCRIMGARLQVKTGLALVAAVGRGLHRCAHATSRLPAAAARAGIEVRLAAGGASDLASYLVVGEADAARAVRALHAALYERAPRRRSVPLRRGRR